MTTVGALESLQNRGAVTIWCRTMWSDFLFYAYTIVSSTMLAYGLNFYYLTYRSTRNNRKPERVNPGQWPTVTVQLPIYTERYVARRLNEAVCQLDYPPDNFEVQVLDDSTDDTQQICTEAVSQFKEKDVNISYIHRDSRVGFKAGALQEGLKTAAGEFIAIFDADFVTS